MLLRVEVIKSDPWLTAKGSTLLNYSVKTNPWPDDWFQTYTHTHTQTYATVFICDANTHSHTSSLSFWYTPTDTLRSVSLSFINQHTQTALRSSNRRSLQTRNAVLNMSSDDPPSLLSSLSSTVRISVFPSCRDLLFFPVTRCPWSSVPGVIAGMLRRGVRTVLSPLTDWEAVSQSGSQTPEELQADALQVCRLF